MNTDSVTRSDAPELHAGSSVDVSIICVNWNSVDYLLECIPSILEYTKGISFEIIVVDNASPDGNPDVLKQRFPEITLIRSTQNLGFAGANNLGVRHSSGRCLLFLNPDTKLVSPAVQTMLHHLDRLTDVGVVGCKLLNADLSVQTSCIMKYPSISNIFLQVEHLRVRWPQLWGIGPLFANSAEPVKVEAISGACMLMQREVFERVGMFSEDYFMYAEDLDLCFKMSRAGLCNYFVEEAVIIHYAGKSSAPEWQTVMKLKSELRFCAKNYGKVYGWMFHCALVVNSLVRLLLIAILSTFTSRSEEKAPLRSASARWSATIKALLAPGWMDSRFAPRPNGAPN